jgi:hypothetical protein
MPSASDVSTPKTKREDADMSNDDQGKQHIKNLAAATGIRIGAGLGNAVAASWPVATTSIWAVPLGGIMLGTSLLLGGGAILGGIACYKLAQKLLDDKKKEEN